DVQNGASTTPTPPVNTSPPTITGTPQDGQTLSASTGSWSGTQPITYGYQWQRCDSGGANCAPITGATGPTYTATSADVGRTLRVVATGSTPALPATLPIVDVQNGPATAPSPPVNTSPPTITGTPQDGQTLS